MGDKNWHLIIHEDYYESGETTIKSFKTKEELLMNISQEDMDDVNIDIVIIHGEIYSPIPEKIKIVTKYVLGDFENPFE